VTRLAESGKLAPMTSKMPPAKQVGAAKAPMTSKMPPTKQVGARVKAAREARDFTQVTFARAMKVTRGAVSNWEVGKGITRANLTRVSEITGASIEWLMTGQGGSGIEAANGSDLVQLADQPLDVVFLQALLSATLVAIGLSPEQGQFLARAVIGAARRPLSEQADRPDENLTNRVASALARAIRP
jgi:transcriptional regulator with XRE-family HTH domain